MSSALGFTSASRKGIFELGAHPGRAAPGVRGATVSHPGSAGGDLIVVADAHIGRLEPEARRFCEFLDSVADAAEVVLLGDIVSLWLGHPKFTLPHHHLVLETCRRLRRRGVRVAFVEGNREFGAGRWRGDAFDEVGPAVTVENWGGWRWRFVHGDGLNPEDWLGGAFRRVVRSRAVLALLRSLPASAGLELAQRIAGLLAGWNLPSKTSIPEELFARYADWLASHGYDAGAIGHVHVELMFRKPGPAADRRTLFVLPDWGSTQRPLRAPASGGPRVESWRAGAPPAPAVIAVHEERGAARLRLERNPGLVTGDAIAVNSGHGSAARAGRVLDVAAQDPAEITVQLDPGPRIQIGDRVTSGAARGENRDAATP